MYEKKYQNKEEQISQDSNEHKSSEFARWVRHFAQVGGAYKGRTQVPPTAPWEPAHRKCLKIRSLELGYKSLPLERKDFSRGKNRIFNKSNSEIEQSEYDLVISGQELYFWRARAIKAAIVAEVSPQEVDWLLQELTGLDSLTLRLGLLPKQKQVCLNTTLTQLDNLWQQRLKERLPVQYLVGKVSWRHFKLKVSPAVLIPRPETELLIDLVSEEVQKKKNTKLISGNWVDLGTGSGAIALGLAEILPEANIHAVDRSQAALAIAQENADNLNLADRIKFDRGNWWQPLSHLKGKVSGMVSNPPYIPTSELPSLQPEVFKHEPHLALDGGRDGLEDIRYLIKASTNYLLPGGMWLIEMMAGQADAVKDMLEDNGCYDHIQVFKDLAGIERFALAYRC